MFRQTVMTFLVVVVVLGLAAPEVFARTVSVEGARELTLIEVGAKAPDFVLFGVDLKYHSLAHYRDKDAVVLIFHCNHCPISVNNIERMVALGNEYQPRNVQFLIINPNPADKVAAEGFAQMTERAADNEYPFPYLTDETQEVSYAYGARQTDHVFILGRAQEDGSRHVEFIGPVDNRGQEPVYIADVLDKLLAGEEVEPKEVAAFGCTIKYRTQEERIARFGYDVFGE